jgi:hypothetical protein
MHWYPQGTNQAGKSEGQELFEKLGYDPDLSIACSLLKVSVSFFGHRNRIVRNLNIFYNALKKLKETVMKNI